MPVDEQTRLNGRSAHGRSRPLRNRIIAVLVLLLTVFLASFLPQYAKARRLTNELREARQENSLVEVRDLAGLVYFQTSQKNYGLAAQTGARFFSRAREVASQTPESRGGKALASLVSFRDPITAGLAKGDPGVLNDVQALFIKTREVTSDATVAASSE